MNKLTLNDKILKSNLKTLLSDEQKLIKSYTATISSKRPFLDKKRDLFFMQHRQHNITKSCKASP